MTTTIQYSAYWRAPGTSLWRPRKPVTEHISADTQAFLLAWARGATRWQTGNLKPWHDPGVL